MSPGWNENDVKRAKTQEERDWYHERRKGYQPLSGPGRSGWKWWTSRTREFGNWQALQSKIAILNIGAHHSKKAPGHSFLPSLPSSRVSLDGAQTVLFPEAIAGGRLVVCLRAHRFWGLEPNRQYGKALFAPEVNRGGHMKNEPMGDEIKRAVKAAIALA